MRLPRIQPTDLLQLAFQSLGANKLRSSLTMLGITIGMFSVVGVMTALSAVRISIDSGLSFLGTHVFQIRKDPARMFIDGGDRSWWRRPNITLRESLQFSREMGEHGYPTSLIISRRGQRARFEDRTTSPRIEIAGTNEHFLTTQKYEISYGRNLVDSDIEFNRPVAVIGPEIEDALFPDESPLDRSIVLGREKYTVIGVLKPRGMLFGRSLDNLALVPVTRFSAQGISRWQSLQVSVQAPSAEGMQEAMDSAIATFRGIRGLGPGVENNFEIVSNESLQASFAEIANYVSIGGLIISAIALVCAGIGIMNIMLVSVTERTREIGLRKSVGARRRDILIQFLLEAVFLSLLGGLGGILLGWGAGNGVAVWMGVQMIVPWFWILTALLICSAIGIGFGFFPALRAARLAPIEALRYE
jgi:putative ABC transport system permease protein